MGSRIKAWFWDRADEPSTWRGIIALLTAFGVTLEPAQAEAIIAAGIALIGVVGTFTSDKRRVRRMIDKDSGGRPDVWAGDVRSDRPAGAPKRAPAATRRYRPPDPDERAERRARGIYDQDPRGSFDADDI